MFNKKENVEIIELCGEIKALQTKIRNLEESCLGKLDLTLWHFHPDTIERVKNKSHESMIERLQKENEKLKAIVAELCDYVYRENK